MRNIYVVIKLLIVCAFIGVGILFAFQDKCSQSLNGIIAGIALIESFIIAEYEMRGIQK